MRNHAVAIHNHPEEALAKPLVLSFSKSRYPGTTFGEYIKRARLEKGLRQVDMARMIEDESESTLVSIT